MTELPRAHDALRSGPLGACLVALLLWPLATFAQTPLTPLDPLGSAHSAPRLTITLLGASTDAGTFEARVSSWFHDETRVRVNAATNAGPAELFAADSGEVRAFVILVSSQRALLTFSCVSEPGHARHLVEDVPLRDGLDELGLERLAAVVHSAFLALREGTKGMDRAAAERALDAAGIGLPGAEGEAPAASSIAPPRSAAPRSGSQRVPRKPAREPGRSPLSVSSSIGYGAHARGAEGWAHGPELSVGVMRPAAHLAYRAEASAQFLFRSAFHAEPFDASVQTTALRLLVGVEPSVAASWSTFFGLGAGADIARIRADAPPMSAAEARSSGTQWRAAGQLSAGLIHASRWFDVELRSSLALFFDDVRYSAATASGEKRLITPSRFQPGVVLACRFHSPL